MNTKKRHLGCGRKMKCSVVILIIITSFFGLFNLRCEAQEENASTEFAINLSDETVGEKQVIELNRLVPGMLSSFVLNARNGSRQNLNLTQVNVSCGCMIVEPVKSQLATDEAVAISVKIRADTNSREVARELSVVNEDGRRWNFVLKCKSLAPFVTDDRHFLLEPKQERRSFKVCLAPNPECPNLYPQSSEEFSVSSTGIVIESPKLEYDGGMWYLEFVANSRVNKLAGLVSDDIELMCSKFKFNLNIKFEFPNPVRVVPDRVRRFAIREGLQKILILSAGKDLNQKICIQGEVKDGEAFDLEFSKSESRGRATVFELAPTALDLSSLSKIKVKSESLGTGEEVVLAVIDVVD